MSIFAMTASMTDYELAASLENNAAHAHSVRAGIAMLEAARRLRGKDACYVDRPPPQLPTLKAYAPLAAEA